MKSFPLLFKIFTLTVTEHNRPCVPKEHQFAQSCVARKCSTKTVQGEAGNVFPEAGSRSVCCWAAFGQRCSKNEGAQWDKGSIWAEFTILNLKHEWGPFMAHSHWSLQQGLEKTKGNYLRPGLHIWGLISDHWLPRAHVFPNETSVTFQSKSQGKTHAAHTAVPQVCSLTLQGSLPLSSITEAAKYLPQLLLRKI